MATALINGVAYEWSSIKFNVLGVPVVGIDAIEYKDSQDMENNYGAGVQPVSRSYGQVSYEGSITLHMAEVEAIQDAISSGRLQDAAEFDIVVSFQPTGGSIRTHTLQFCRFMENSRSLTKGDKVVAVEIPLLIGGIKWK